jgi:hypothetical protein
MPVVSLPDGMLLPRSQAGKTYARSRASEENQGAHVRRTLVAQHTRGHKQSADTIGLQGATSKGRSPGCGSAGSLLRLGKLLLRVGGLGAVVGVAEDGSEDGKGDEVGVGGAEGDGRGLDGWEV